MSRRANETVTVQLFPFLAVLVCTMGSLIFLLLVTTRQIRNRAVAYAAFQLEQQQLELTSQQPPGEVVETKTQELIPFPPPSPPTPPTPPEPQPSADDKAYELALAERERQQEELEAEWKRKAKELKRLRDQRRNALSERKTLVDASLTQTNAVKSEVGQLELKLGALAGEAAATAMSATNEAEQMVIEQQVADMKKRLKAAQAAEASSANDKFQVIPFDAASGTTRRPILIECTVHGIRFLPEDVVITARDLEGFTQRANPLAVGTAALIGYWTEWNSKQKNPRSQPEPYPLLLVRPDGEVAYYVAMKMLEPIRTAHGYELIDSDTALALPPVDPGAKMALEVAVKQLLAERENIYRAATHPGSGAAVFGRHGRRGGTGTRFGAGTGSGTGSGPGEAADADKNASPGPRSGTAPGFTMDDIAPAEEGVGARSWERIENFQGRRRSGSDGSLATGTAEGKRGGATRERPGASANNSDVSDTDVVAEDEGTPSKPTGSIRSAKGTDKSGRLSTTSSKTGVTLSTGDPSSEEGDAVAEGDPTQSESTESPQSAQAGKGHSQAGGRGDKPSSHSNHRGRGESPISESPGAKQRRSPSDREKQLEPEMLAGRHWGKSEPGALIGFEHDVRVEVYEDRLIIAKKYEVRVEEGQSRRELFESFIGALDRHTQEWGSAPQGFFWTPRLKFIVKPEATSVYERTNTLMNRSGLSTSHAFSDDPDAEPIAPRKSAPKKVATKPRSGAAK